MSHPANRDRLPKACFPRVSGDEPPATDWMADRRVFSPRERG